MKLIYIAGPIRAATDWKKKLNIDRAEALSLVLWKSGFVTFLPHTAGKEFSGELDDKTILNGDKEILKRCDAVLLMENWETSEGSKGEMKFATGMEIPVFDDIKDLIRWRDGE